MIGNYKAVQQENFQLREYIIQLQARLLDAHSDVPPPPAHIDLANPPQRPEGPAAAGSSSAAPTAPMSSNAVEELRLAAAAAAQAADITTGGNNQEQTSSSGEAQDFSFPQDFPPLDPQELEQLLRDAIAEGSGKDKE
jgi:hypothetical protein